MGEEPSWRSRTRENLFSMTKGRTRGGDYEGSWEDSITKQSPWGPGAEWVWVPQRGRAREMLPSLSGQQGSG